MSILPFLAMVVGGASPPAVTGAAVAAFDPNGVATHVLPSSGYILPALSTALILTCYGDSGQAFASPTPVRWAATGVTAQNMTALPAHANASGGLTVIQQFYLANPSFGTASGAGQFEIPNSPGAPTAIVARAFRGWNQLVAPLDNWAAGGGSASPPSYLAFGIPPNWLMFHDICGSDETVGVNLGTDDVQDFDGAFGATVLRASANRRSGGVGGTITITTSFTGAPPRFVEAAAVFAA
jgi:hypothetical protein